ncbi:PEP-CTERM sorting domain-containing protein [Roseibacillus persicicus]|uniref:PEP-CTERM sorting domain-containing protein n=1 Tax=Roseibacillus persicicus TaxID=454148 RepID=UPI00398B6735
MKTRIALFLGLALNSQAAVIWSGIQDIPIPVATGIGDLDGVFIDIDQPGLSSVATILEDSNEVNFTLGGTGLFTGGGFLPVRQMSSATGAVVKLLPGDSVEVATAITGPTGLGANQEVFAESADDFFVGESAYLGFLFSPDGTSTLHPGWMRVTLTNNTPGGVVHEWAYESDPQSAIVVGAVPEPATAILAFLGLGLVLRRRR